MENDCYLMLFQFKGFEGPAPSRVFRNYHRVGQCKLCERSDSTLNYEGISVELFEQFRIWPDIIKSVDMIIMSENVVTTLNDDQFTGYRAHPLKVTYANDRTINSRSNIPKYYAIEITGTVELDTQHIDDIICPACFHLNSLVDKKYKPLLPLVDTWDGSDFVSANNLKQGIRYCSRRFIEAASREKWSNFIFGQTLPGIALWDKAPKGRLSYKDANWFARISEKVESKYSDR